MFNFFKSREKASQKEPVENKNSEELTEEKRQELLHQIKTELTHIHLELERLENPGSDTDDLGATLASLASNKLNSKTDTIEGLRAKQQELEQRVAELNSTKANDDNE